MTALALAKRYWKMAALGLALLAVWFHFASDARVRGERDRLRADVSQWQKANATNLASVKRTTAALNDQSARVRALAAASDARQKAAQDALRAATARRGTAEGVAVRIERAGPVAGCVTAPEIMEAEL